MKIQVPVGVCQHSGREGKRVERRGVKNWNVMRVWRERKKGEQEKISNVASMIAHHLRVGTLSFMHMSAGKKVRVGICEYLCVCVYSCRPVVG